MSDTAVSLPAPAGYVTGRERGARVVALPSVFEEVVQAIRQHGSLYDAAGLAGAEAFTGRGAAYRMSLGNAQAVIRHYRRGGAVARLLGDRYVSLGRTRPHRELEASAQARLRGVDTPEVLAAITYTAPPFYRADIATRFIPGARDLATAALSKTRADAADRMLIWRAAGTLLNAAFQAGVEHADLNLRNILITNDARAFLLDLDRAVVRAHPIGAAARAAMLSRLHRSRRKLESHFGTSASPQELAAFEAGLGAE